MAAPSTQALLTQWSWEPSVLIGVAALAALYFYAIGPLRERHNWGPPATRAQVTYFEIALVLLIVALLSPIDYIGDEYLFSAHMVQHLLLATLWPPLMLLACPSWLAARLLRLPGGALVRSFTHPGMALLLFNADIYLWHIPPLYDLTLANEQVHILEHLTFMACGLLVWRPVLSPIRAERLSYPLQVLYLFANGMLMMVLGIVFTFAPVVLYTPYATAPRLWGISALSDQQIGGLIMWYPGNIPYGYLLVVAFYRWFDGDTIPAPERSAASPASPTIGPPVP